MFILWLMAVILVLIGLKRILDGDVFWGTVAILAGLMIGPGGFFILDL